MVESQDNPRRRGLGAGALVLIGIVVTIGVFAAAGLLMSIFEHKAEQRRPFVRLVEVDEDTINPATWGVNWPRQYESYLRTVDYQRTRYGGSDAVPEQKLDHDPFLRVMWAGYAFSLDYREARGHAYMLIDQEVTERVLQRPQPGACLHCHSSPLRAYRHAGEGDVMEGFRRVNAMPWSEARNLRDEHGEMLIQHPVSCIDCHDPQTMALRVTRPAFINGIRDLMAGQGRPDFDPNIHATRQQMRTFVCAQCHVEYYFTKPDNQLVYPWAKGLKVEQIEAYYDEINFFDWTHAITGAPALKAQHPEFEMWSQGIHARSGVACADCHMPYERQGAMKISNHHVRSPLLNVAQSCQVCHNIPEAELLNRAMTIQDTTRGLIDRAGEALTDMIRAIAAAKQAGATDEQLAPALHAQRRAQWRLDFVYSENSMGFHAPQEAARILAESIDYSRLGEREATRLIAAIPQPDLPKDQVMGVTPEQHAPPGPERQAPAPPGPQSPGSPPPPR